MKKFFTWLKGNITAFIFFTLIIAASIYLLLSINKWVLFTLLLVFYVGWTAYKVFKNEKL
jgi:hypothetical protein